MFYSPGLRAFACRLLLWLAVIALPASLHAQEGNPLLAVDTSSPQATMRTFYKLTDAVEVAYVNMRDAPTAAQQAEVQRLMRKFMSIFDLSQISPTARTEIGGDAVVFLVDVLRRIDIPPLETIPGASAFSDVSEPASWSIPESEITIARLMDGPQKGKFLFDAETVARAGEFYALTKHLPLKKPSYVPSWREAQLQSHGWMIPAGLVRSLPELLKQPVFDTPIWKVLGTLIISALMAAVFALWHRLTRPSSDDYSPASYVRRLLMPLALVGAIFAARFLISNQINVIGAFGESVEYVLAIGLYVACAWAAWLIVFLVIEWVISSPTIPDQGLDANLLRLLGRVVGILGAASVAAYGGQQLGLPVVGVIAGLGVGGLAVALAAQSSIENLIGGLNLYADRPVRVGDFCEYAGIKGHVVHIGLRSTRIRALDRTVTAVPNSVLAKEHVTNYTLRDQMLFRHILDLRYETTTEQLRMLSTSIRDYLSAHPQVAKDIALPRVHVIGFGDWSIKLEIYCYLDTRDIPEFLAIQEQLNLQLIELVDRAGADFAFPSHTTYLARDTRPAKSKSTSTSTFAPATLVQARAGTIRRDG